MAGDESDTFEQGFSSGYGRLTAGFTSEFEEAIAAHRQGGAGELNQVYGLAARRSEQQTGECGTANVGYLLRARIPGDGVTQRVGRNDVGQDRQSRGSLEGSSGGSQEQAGVDHQDRARGCGEEKRRSEQQGLGEDQDALALMTVGDMA